MFTWVRTQIKIAVASTKHRPGDWPKRYVPFLFINCYIVCFTGSFRNYQRGGHAHSHQKNDLNGMFKLSKKQNMWHLWTCVNAVRAYFPWSILKENKFCNATIIATQFCRPEKRELHKRITRFPAKDWYNILLPRRADTWFPYPQQCTDVRSMLTSQPKFLGWIVYQII